jgi:hypothetical protein
VNPVNTQDRDPNCQSAAAAAATASCAVAISQESFDALVAEGIEEFDLTREEAVKDAIQQFTAQGTLLDTLYFEAYVEYNCISMLAHCSCLHSYSFNLLLLI